MISSPRAIWLALALLGTLPGGGCATLEKAFSEEGVLYKPTARGNYEAGMEALTDKDWEDADKYFRHVRNKFPYSKYAVLAQLRIADSHFGDEKYLEAIDAYRTFIKLHPKHAEVPYATFRIAESFAERMPDEWFFLPPVEEKDQTQAHDAQRALKDFLARYPDDTNAARAKELLADVRHRLVAHELYAARFYRRSSHWRAVAWRSQAVARRYPDAPEAAVALLEAGAAYEELGEGKAALRMYQQLVERYPQSESATSARQKIQGGVAHPEVDETAPQPPEASAPTTAPAAEPAAVE